MNSPQAAQDAALLALYGGEPVRPTPIDTTVAVSDTARREISRLIDSGVLTGWHGGPHVRRFEDMFAAYHGNGFHAVAVNSGTSALHLALVAAGIGPGDEVVVPAVCFVSAASAVVQQHAIPVICDVEPVSLTLDAKAVREAITPRTKAVLPVHLWGYPADLTTLRALCDEHGLVMIEDACQAPGAPTGGAITGTFGDFAAYSFAFRKHVSTGDGGMVLTRDETAAEQVRVLANVGKGDWEDYRSLGYSYRMVEFSALVGADGLTRIDAEIAARQQAARVYAEALAETGIVPLPEPAWGQSVYFKLPLVLPPELVEQRSFFARAIQAENVSCRVPHPPLWTIDWLADYLAQQGRYRGAAHCPVAAASMPRVVEVETGPHLPLEEAVKSAHAVTKVWHHVLAEPQ